MELNIDQHITSDFADFERDALWLSKPAKKPWKNVPLPIESKTHETQRTPRGTQHTNAIIQNS